MECFVCNADAEELPTLGDWTEIRCDDGCGHYRLSGTLSGELAVNGRRLSVDRTRMWLEINRVTHPAPLITSSTAIYA
jgi:hypothetical protein